MPDIRFVLQKIEEAVAIVGKIKGRYADMSKPFKQASVYMVASVQKNFLEEGRPTVWTPLSLITRLIRGKKAKILRDTGRLFNSITPEYDIAAGTFGATSNVSYARLMNFGGKSAGGEATVPPQQRRTKNGKVSKVRSYTMTIKPAQVPARPFMILQEEDRPRIRKMFKEYLDG